MASDEILRATPKISNGGRVVALDGFRGALALLVLFHHVLITQPDFANFEWSKGTTSAHGIFEWLLFYTPAGLFWIGQERALLFFVLSGYVLSLPWLKNRSPSYAHFLIGRFCRVYAPYIFIMMLAAAGAFLVGGKHLPNASVWFNQLGWAFHLSWKAFPSVILLLNNGSSNWVNESIWSLVWEVRVAFVFPVIMFVIMRWRNTGLILMLGALVIFQPAINYIMPHNIALKFGNAASLFYYPVFFILGIAVSLNQEKIQTEMRKHGAFWGILVFTIGLLICWVPWPFANNFIDGIGAAVIIAAILGSNVVSYLFEHRSLVWLGRISYSLYLVHVPIILLIVVLFKGRVPVIVCMTMIPICIAIGDVFHRYIEVPSVAISNRSFVFMTAPPESEAIEA